MADKKTKSVTVKLPLPVHKKIRLAAITRGITLADMCAHIIERYADKCKR